MKVIEGDGPKGCKYVSTKVSPAGALRASLAVVSAVAAAVPAAACSTNPKQSKRAPAKSTAALPFFEFNDGLPSSLACHPCPFPHTDGA